MPSMWRRSTIRLFLLVAVTVASIHFEGDLSLQASFAIVAVIACSWSWTDNAIQPAFSPHQISLEPRIGLMLIDLGFMDDAQWKALFVPEKESDPWSGLTLAKSGARAVVLSLASSGDMIVQLASPTARFEFPWALGSTLEFPEPFFPCSPAFFFDLGNLGRAKYFAQNSPRSRTHLPRSVTIRTRHQRSAGKLIRTGKSRRPECLSIYGFRAYLLMPPQSHGVIAPW